MADPQQPPARTNDVPATDAVEKLALGLRAIYHSLAELIPHRPDLERLAATGGISSSEDRALVGYAVRATAELVRLVATVKGLEAQIASEYAALLERIREASKRN